MMIVKSNLPGGKVALWESHPDHPEGEVFIAGDRKILVAETTAVKAAIKRGNLIEVEIEVGPPAKPKLKRKTRKAE